MTSPEVLGLAKQGDPAAIATLMNQVTQPRGITVRVKQQGNCLHLLFEAEQIPKQQTAVSFVRTSLDILKVHSFKSIRVYGRQQGSHHTSWHQVIQLQSFFEISPGSQLTESETVADLSKLEESEQTPEQVTELMPSVTESMLPPTPSSRAEPEVPPDPNAHEVVLVPMDTSSSLVQRPESALAEISEVPELLKRPESIVMVFGATLLIFWEAYLALLDELAPPTALSCRQLAMRLGVSKSTVRKRKRQTGFTEWARDLDPDGTAWVYQSGGLYLPLK